MHLKHFEKKEISGTEPKTFRKSLDLSLADWHLYKTLSETLLPCSCC